MPWTKITRPNYVRGGPGYASDPTDAEWNLIEPMLPPASRIGRPRTTDLRAVVSAILYMATTGCQWRQMPKDFPPYSTVQGYFYGWVGERHFCRDQSDAGGSLAHDGRTGGEPERRCD